MNRSFFTNKTYSYDYGIFKERPNRFIAHVIYKNRINLRCHVPDPGRLKELLIEGRKVLLRFSPDQKSQKTDASVIGVFEPEQELWVSLDSQLANRFIKHSWKKLPFLKDFEEIKPEFTFGGSRLDFLFSSNKKKCLVEVKTATLVKNGIGKFPDAPTKRGSRHVLELVSAKEKGYECIVIFVVPRSDATCVKPNKNMDLEFFNSMKKALKNQINVMVFLCDFNPEGLVFQNEIPFRIE